TAAWRRVAIERRRHDIITEKTVGPGADLSAARSQSEAAGPEAAAALLRLAFPHLRTLKNFSLCAGAHVHALRRAEGEAVRSASLPRLRARRLRAVVLPRHRPCGRARRAEGRQGPLPRRRAAH